jgi:Flp pilus assembly pilin Flp
MWLRKLFTLFADERGVTSTEYAVMLALILGTCTTAVNCLGQSANNTFQSVSSSISTSGPGGGS